MISEKRGVIGNERTVDAHVVSKRRNGTDWRTWHLRNDDIGAIHSRGLRPRNMKDSEGVIAMIRVLKGDGCGGLAGMVNDIEP